MMYRFKLFMVSCLIQWNVYMYMYGLLHFYILYIFRYVRVQRPSRWKTILKILYGQPSQNLIARKMHDHEAISGKILLEPGTYWKKKFFCFDTIYTHLVIMEVWKLSFTAVDSDPVVFYIDNLYVDLTSQWVYWVSKDFGYIPCSLLEWIRLQTGHLACMCVTQSY
jgi:hypothetical protein